MHDLLIGLGFLAMLFAPCICATYVSGTGSAGISGTTSEKSA